MFERIGLTHVRNKQQVVLQDEPRADRGEEPASERMEEPPPPSEVGKLPKRAADGLIFKCFEDFIYIYRYVMICIYLCIDIYISI